MSARPHGQRDLRFGQRSHDQFRRKIHIQMSLETSCFWARARQQNFKISLWELRVGTSLITYTVAIGTIRRFHMIEVNARK